MPITEARLRISEYNDRRKANVRRQESRIRMISLSLTSMVDMFAILVIFLLANSSTVSQWIEVSHDIQLPQARKTEPPVLAATLQISRTAIFGGDKNIITVSQAQQTTGMIPAVKTWLAKNAKKGEYVNIVAHHKIPFGVIRRVIATCQESGYKNVNLAVQPKGSS